MKWGQHIYQATTRIADNTTMHADRCTQHRSRCCWPPRSSLSTRTPWGYQPTWCGNRGPWRSTRDPLMGSTALQCSSTASMWTVSIRPPTSRCCGCNWASSPVRGALSGARWAINLCMRCQEYHQFFTHTMTQNCNTHVHLDAPRELFRRRELGRFSVGVRVPVGLRDVAVLHIDCGGKGVEEEWRPWTVTAASMFRCVWGCGPQNRSC